MQVVVPDAAAGAVIETLLVAARTGERGDGKILVETVETAVRIRTGERDDNAL